MLIGRSRRCDLTVRSPLVSRRHCRLEKRDSGAFLRDLGSQNGTWIDGERIDHAFLQTGDRFVAGDVVLRLLADGGVEEEGSTNPRKQRNAPRLKDQGPALALIFLPLLGVTALLVLTSFGEGGKERDPRLAGNGAAPAGGNSASANASNPGGGGALGENPAIVHDSAPGSVGGASNSHLTDPNGGSGVPETQRPHPAGGAAPRGGAEGAAQRSTDPSSADPSSADSSSADSGSADRNGATSERSKARGEGAGSNDGPLPQSYSLEDLLSIAQTCDEELAARESDMAALLAGVPEGTESDLRPPSLEESWKGIAANTGAGGSPAPTFWNAPRGGERKGTTAARAGTVERRSPQTAVVSGEEAELAGPLFPEAARQDIANAIVEEARGMIDRYHVRDVSFVPLRPLITRLRDLDGVPAAHGLLSLREYTHDHLGRVYRRVRKLEREARQSGNDLDRGVGGAAARQDELTLRLSEMVKEHLETLVLIRDDLESALAHEGRPAFLREVLSAALVMREPALFLLGSRAAREHDCTAVIPQLIDGLKSGNVKIRRSARETLEQLTGEKPGTSHRAWREWWDLHEGKESVR